MKIEIELKLPEGMSMDEYSDFIDNLLFDHSELVLHSNITGDPVGEIKSIRIIQEKPDA